MDEDKRKMTDDQLYARFDSLEIKLTAAIKEAIETVQKYNDKTLDRHTGDLNQLFEHDRENRDRFGVIEADVKNLKEDKEDNKHNKEIRVGVWAIAVTIILGVGAWIISLFK